MRHAGAWKGSRKVTEKKAPAAPNLILDELGVVQDASQQDLVGVDLAHQRSSEGTSDGIWKLMERNLRELKHPSGETPKALKMQGADVKTGKGQALQRK